MDIEAFWELIEEARDEANGDVEAQCGALGEKLKALPAEEIESFGNLLDEMVDRAYDWNLWGAAFVIAGGCSDDSFMDFRGWLISRGRQTFETALADADALADLIGEDDGECQCESFLYVPAQAWGGEDRR